MSDQKVHALLTDARMIIVCGPGGVGKTTSAAALGVLAAQTTEKRVLVLTVDPARRLATALGLTALGNTEVPVPLPNARGSLTMAMIDTKASWDDMIRRHAPDTNTRDKVLGNELYRTLTSRFVHSHDYVVTERLFDARESGNYDLVIVDTPPSRSALSVLDAPRRMEQFFSSRLLKLLTAPAQSRVLSLASRPFFIVADRILGARFLADIAEFFTLFRTMERPVVDRARRVGALLTNTETSYLVVSSAEPVAMLEADYLVRELRRRSHHLSAVLLNRLVPLHLAVGAAQRAERLAASTDPMLRVFADAERTMAAVAQHEAAQVDVVASWGADVLYSETRQGDITDTDALAQLGASISARPRTYGGVGTDKNGR
ncbi:MAG: ArsA family ATPase [Actinobacteria bacterium]|jgi:anion-transporting  ArsA/GET3 family ATPase|nr:ArsA family ATPase [Actinomycetota bacterium]NDH45237.1 ArsA family ATPase [Actinomycetota bacterium]